MNPEHRVAATVPVDGCSCGACQAARAFANAQQEAAMRAGRFTGLPFPSARQAARAVEQKDAFQSTVRFNKLRNGEPARSWVIVRINGKNEPGGSPNTIQIDNRPSLIHTSAVDTANEAERLAKANPGAVFIVFEAKVATRLPATELEVIGL